MVGATRGLTTAVSRQLRIHSDSSNGISRLEAEAEKTKPPSSDLENVARKWTRVPGCGRRKQIVPRGEGSEALVSRVTFGPAFSSVKQGVGSDCEDPVLPYDAIIFCFLQGLYLFIFSRFFGGVGGSGVCYFKLFVSYGLKLIGVLILPLPVTIAKWPWPGDLTCWSVSACYAGDVLAP